MTTTYDEQPNPIENGVQRVYTDIHESLALILSVSGLPIAERCNILNDLNDAVSNNWDELMHGFWRGVQEDVEALYDPS